MSHDARAVANLLLDVADGYNVPIGTLALQKILYFIHGYWLAKLEKPIIHQSFEAWQYGPVVRLIYDSFKDTPKGKRIDERVSYFDYHSGKTIEGRANLSNSERKFFDQLFLKFAKINVYRLVEISHIKGGPWDLVGSDQELVTDGIIDNELIQAHFMQIKDPIITN